MQRVHQKVLKTIKRVVIKIGSGILTNHNELKALFFQQLADEIASLRRKKIDVVLVSSGAIACGMGLLGLKKRPTDLYQEQAVAAIGQPQLMNLYSKVFLKYRFRAAQMLLTRADLEDKNRFLNARHAVMELLREKVVPIINENDSVAVEEIKFGDNDQLSAMVAHLVEADLLIVLTDIDGLYDEDPKRSRRAKRIPIVERVDDKIFRLAKGTSSARSRGGMVTKLLAARYAARYGIPTWIVNGRKPKILREILAGHEVGTLFLA